VPGIRTATRSAATAASSREPQSREPRGCPPTPPYVCMRRGFLRAASRPGLAVRARSHRSVARAPQYGRMAACVPAPPQPPAAQRTCARNRRAVHAACTGGWSRRHTDVCTTRDQRHPTGGSMRLHPASSRSAIRYGRRCGWPRPWSTPRPAQADTGTTSHDRGVPAATEPFRRGRAIRLAAWSPTASRTARTRACRCPQRRHMKYARCRSLAHPAPHRRHLASSTRRSSALAPLERGRHRASCSDLCLVDDDTYRDCGPPRCRQVDGNVCFSVTLHPAHRARRLRHVDCRGAATARQAMRALAATAAYAPPLTQRAGCGSSVTATLRSCAPGPRAAGRRRSGGGGHVKLIGGRSSLLRPTCSSVVAAATSHPLKRDTRPSSLSLRHCSRAPSRHLARSLRFRVPVGADRRLRPCDASSPSARVGHSR
jgi:hypothetical protein